jgi:choline dehydrogenase-like flavoprotein
MIYDLDTVEVPQTSLAAPICVIGGGIAGLFAAKKIADARELVVVIESGGLKFDSKYSLLTHPDLPTDLYRGGGQVRILGGGSTVWGGCMIPLTCHDLSSRPYLDLERWPLPHQVLTSFSSEVEDLLELDHSSYEGHDASTGKTSTSVFNKAAGLAIRKPKFPTYKNGDLRNLLYDYIRKSPYLHLWLNSTVSDFSVDPCRGRVSSARAMSLGHKTLVVEASQFIIACGTLESTRLLLLLNRISDENAFRDCPALGHYFHTHLKTDVGHLRRSIGDLPSRLGAHVVGRTRRSVHLEMTGQAQADDRVASGYLTFRYVQDETSISSRILARLKRVAVSVQKPSEDRESFKTESARADSLEHYLHQYYWRLWRYAHATLKDLTCTLEARIEQIPSFQNFLSLSSATDQMGSPFLNCRWAQGSLEVKTLNALGQRGKEFWKLSGLDGSSPVDWKSDELLQELPMQDASHPAGSARMGYSRRNSVVDVNLRCHSIPNVQVASAAVFPSSGGSNPTLTIMQLALYAASIALDQRRLH